MEDRGPQTVAAPGRLDHIASMDAKQRLREEARDRREREPGRPAKSLAIQRRVEGLQEYRVAPVVASYVGIRSEVETRGLLEGRLARQAPTAVVYRDGPTLGICLIRSLDELELGSFDLWEPRQDLRLDPARQCSPGAVDLFLVPGLAFDLRGGRIGYGRGYYDSLLGNAGPNSTFLGLAFESQIVDRVPMTARDIPVHMILTELADHRASSG